MRTYFTGKGDNGFSFVRGKRRIKSSKTFDAIGDVDELISVLGLAKNLIEIDEVKKVVDSVQRDLFRVNAYLAGFEEKFTIDRVRKLELMINEFGKDLPELRTFIVPSGCVGSAILHIARAICRRAERHIVSIRNEVSVNSSIIPYMNRLSSLLFVLARYVDLKEGKEEEKL